jgi:putative transposase
MLGFKSFHSARLTLSGIENIKMVQKGQIIGQQKNNAAFKNFVNLMA